MAEKNIHERLKDRRDAMGSLPKLSDADVAKAKGAFAEHQDWNDVYLAHDGRLFGGDEFRKMSGSLLKQLNVIGSVGFPVNIGRGHSQIMMDGEPIDWTEIPGDKISAPLSVSGEYVISHRTKEYNVSFRPASEHHHVACETTLEAAKAAARQHFRSRPGR